MLDHRTPQLQLSELQPPAVMLFTMGRRYRDPRFGDDAIIMSISHRTTGGPVSIALDLTASTALLTWLQNHDQDRDKDTAGTWGQRDHTTTALLSRHDTALTAAISPNTPGGRRRQITLAADQANELTCWLVNWVTASWNPASLAQRARAADKTAHAAA